MSAVDKVRLLETIIPSASADGVRAKTTAENNKRTERYQLRVTGQVDITVGGTGVRNRGSILAACGQVGYMDGGADVIAIDARLASFIANKFAPSALPATRLSAAGIQAATLLSETLPLWMSAPGTVNINETKYVELNKQLAQQAFITPNRLITRLAEGAALVGTITNLSVGVEQIYDDLVNVAPWLMPFTREVVWDVTGTNPALRVDLRGSRYIRGIAIQQDTDQGEVDDIISALVLRGDTHSIIGDRSVPMSDLIDAQYVESGGELYPGYLFIDFARYGRLSTLWNPYQDTNLRIEASVAPSAVAGATGSKVRVGLVEYERNAGTVNPLPIAI